MHCRCVLLWGAGDWASVGGFVSGDDTAWEAGSELGGVSFMIEVFG